MPLSPKLASLATLLRSKTSNSCLELSTDLGLPGNIADLIGSLPNKKLCLRDVTIRDGKSGKSFSVVGTAASDWTVKRLFDVVLRTPRLRFAFSQGRPDAPVTAALEIRQAMLALLAKHIDVTGSLTEDNRISVQLGKGGGDAHEFSVGDLAHVVASFRHSAYLSEGLGIGIFDGITLSDLRIIFGLDGHGAASISVTADAKTNWKILGGGVFELKSVGVTLAADYSSFPNGKPSVSTSVGVHAVTHIGEDFRVAAFPRGRGRWQLDVLPEKGGLPAIGALASAVGPAVGQKQLRDTIEKGLKDLGIGDVSIDGVSVGFDPRKMKLLFLLLRSHAELAGGRIDLRIHLPRFEIAGGLPRAIGGPVPGQKIKLNALAEKFLHPSTDLPEADVTELSFHVCPAEGSYGFDIVVDGDWEVPVGDTSFAVTELEVSIDKFAGGVSGLVSGKATIAGVDFSLLARKEVGRDGGWQFEAAAGDEKGVDLTAFTSAFLKWVGLPSLPSEAPHIVLRHLDLTYNSHTGEFTFSGESLTKATIPLGNTSFTADVEFQASSAIDPETQKRDFGLILGAVLHVAGTELDLTCDIGKDGYLIRGTWGEEGGRGVSVNDVLRELGLPSKVELPEGFDPSLDAVMFEFDVSKQQLTIAADSPQFGEVFLQAGQVMNTAGGQVATQSDTDVVFGVALPPHWKFSDIPGPIGERLQVLDFVEFEAGYLVLSTVALDGYAPPELPGGKGKAFAPMGQHGMSLVAGVNLAFLVDFASSSGQIQKNLSSMLPPGKLLLAAEIDLKKRNVLFEVDLEGAVSLVGGNGSGSRLEIDDAKLKLSLRPPSFQVSGQMQLALGKNTLDAVGRLGITEAEAEAAFEIRSEQRDAQGKPVPASLSVPMGFPGVMLDEIGVELGVMFEPPGVDLGLEGQFHIGDRPVGDDKFAVVMSLEGEIPNPALLYCHIGQLSMEELIVACIDQTVSLPELISDIAISDLMIYWAEGDTLLPDGTIAAQGFGFNGMIDVHGFAAHAKLMIHPQQGFEGDAEMPPVTLPGLSIAGKGQEVKVKQAFVNGQWETVKRFPPTLPGEAQPLTREHVLIPSGGPCFRFSPLHSPYLTVSLDVDLLGSVSEEVFVDVTDKGFEFDLHYRIGDATEFTMSCVLKGRSGFSADASFVLALDTEIGPYSVLDVDVGKIHLDVDLDAELGIAIGAKGFRLNVGGSFEFDGATLTMPDLAIDAPLSSIEALAGEIVKHIESGAKEIFTDLFDSLEGVVQKGLDEAKEIASEAAHEVEQIGKDAEAEAGKAIADARDLGEKAGRELEQETEKVEQEAQDLLDDAAQQAEQVAADAAAEVKKLDRDIVQIGKDIKAEVGNIEASVRSAVSKIEGEAQHAISAAAEEVKRIGKQAEADAKAAVAAGQRAANAAASAARKSVSAIENEARKINREVDAYLKKVADDLKRAAQKVQHAVSRAAKKAWHKISKY